MSAVEEARQALQILVELTSTPPSPASPEEVVTAATSMASARQPYVDTLQKIASTYPGEIAQHEFLRAMRAEVQRRDGLWVGALERARKEMLEQRAAGWRARKAYR